MTKEGGRGLSGSTTPIFTLPIIPNFEDSERQWAIRREGYAIVHEGAWTEEWLKRFLLFSTTHASQHFPTAQRTTQHDHVWPGDQHNSTLHFSSLCLPWCFRPSHYTVGPWHLISYNHLDAVTLVLHLCPRICQEEFPFPSLYYKSLVALYPLHNVYTSREMGSIVAK